MDNHPRSWRAKLPVAKATDNKYTRGYVVVNGGGAEMSGAARLAALSALRVGAGLVRITCPLDALNIYARRITSVMAKAVADVQGFKAVLKDERINSVLIGPGNGVNKRTKEFVLAALNLGINIVLDADALSVFEKNPAALFKAIKKSGAEVILTPHEGEFLRLFKMNGGRQRAVVLAAKTSGAIILLKGSDTIIATPGGDVCINKNAPANLATAGSGDVLAGIIAGLLAQKMKGFDAARVGAYIHAEAARSFGKGLISEDLPGLIPPVLKKLQGPIKRP